MLAGTRGGAKYLPRCLLAQFVRTPPVLPPASLQAACIEQAGGGKGEKKRRLEELAREI